jgi:uncharacterized protein YecE (DUF72 family)
VILVGTSGYNYPEWKGSFYPADLSAKKMLPYYAGRFPTVEINYTFYRMPTPKLIAGWREQVPPSFRFTLKAPKRITHDKRLRAADVEASLHGFLTAASELGPQMAALLFQLPPNFKKDLALLNEFLSLLPPKTTAAFEFRNPSWLEDDVFAALNARNIALCIADSETRDTPLVTTADYAYLRLRDEGYGDGDIARWTDTAKKLGESATDVFVYFKHEDEGKGAAFGLQMIGLLDKTTT